MNSAKAEFAEAYLGICGVRLNCLISLPELMVYSDCTSILSVLPSYIYNLGSFFLFSKSKFGT